MAWKAAVALLGASLFGVLSGCEAATSEVDVQKALISLTEVRRLVEQSEKKPNERLLLLVDPRGKGDYEQGHLPGSRNIPLATIPFDRRIVEDVGIRRPLDPAFKSHEHVVVYGVNPASPAARAMTKRLLSLGVSNTKFFAGGIEEWTAAGWEVEKVAGEEKK